ncbi:MAG TPA: ribonuclease J [Coriobacteriia bacterium]|jgi:ribonuclease J
MTRKKTRLRVIPLGGLDEIGKNMTVVEYGNDMIVIDAGLMFPDDDLPGVDLVLPDYGYVLQRADKLRGIVITHGHEDHTGALPYLLKDLGRSVPVYGSKLTLGLIQGKLSEHPAVKKPKLREVQSGSRIELGVFACEFMQVTHSIPDALAVLVRTPVGNVMHTGDFKLDQTPVDGREPDYAGFTAAGREGVLLMLSDSTGAERPGHTAPEAEVGLSLHRIFAAAKGRIIVASFSSHIHRVQEIVDAAADNGRKIVVTGRSMLNNTRIARDLGYLHVRDEDLFDAFEVKDLPDDETVILCTGSQGEPLSALARIANGDHRTVQVRRGDTVVISASPVPGNEKAVDRVINKLIRAGAHVLYKDNARVHVSGHGAAEELKLMLNMVKPKYFVPVHGEARHLVAHAALAEAVGMPEGNVFVMDNGDCLELTTSAVSMAERVDSGVIYVDGLSVGDVGTVVLRDRQLMAQDGIAMIVVTIDHRNGKVIGEAELVTRGIVFGAGSDGLLEEAKARIGRTLAKTAGEGATDQRVVKNALRESVSQVMWEKARRRPMILPIVMEV